MNEIAIACMNTRMRGMGILPMIRGMGILPMAIHGLGSPCHFSILPMIRGMGILPMAIHGLGSPCHFTVPVPGLDPGIDPGIDPVIHDFFQVGAERV